MIHFDADKIKLVLLKPEGYMNGYPHSKIIWKMLQGLYNRQTSLEKTTEASLVDNGMGFDKYDSNFLSSIARNSKKYKNLTPAQSKAVAKALLKYVRQLVEIANEHQDVKAVVPPKNSKKKSIEPKQQDLFVA